MSFRGSLVTPVVIGPLVSGTMGCPKVDNFVGFTAAGFVLVSLSLMFFPFWLGTVVGAMVVM